MRSVLKTSRKITEPMLTPLARKTRGIEQLKQLLTLTEAIPHKGVNKLPTSFKDS